MNKEPTSYITIATRLPRYLPYNVIDSRWRTQKPLIVTTNLTVEQLLNPPDLAHQRIYDRVIEICVPIKIHGDSMRKDRAQQNMDFFKKKYR